MPLVPVIELLDNARAGGYAVGYFESWNFESLQGVIDAAQQTRSPMIIGFNGQWLSCPGRLAREDISWYAALGKAAAESASVPVGLLFNECAYDDWIRRAMEAGFSQAMLDDPDASPEDVTRRTAELAAFAHAHDASFEAEIGQLPHGESGRIEADDCALTDIDAAAGFVDETGIDVLAISIGNVHLMVQGQQELDLNHIEALRRRLDVHFDLHGGTGIPVKSLTAAIALGVTKVCYGTYVKQRYLAAVRQALSNDCTSPHEHLGFGGEDDMLTAGRIAVREAGFERIHLLGCCGKA